MRQMRGHRQHLVVVLGAPSSRPACRPVPTARVTLASAVGIGVGQRRQDAPAVVEQLGEAGFGPGMLGAGDRVAGHEMHARSGSVGRSVADHRLLDRADIGDDRARRAAPARCARRSRHRPRAASRARRDRRRRTAAAGSSVVSSAMPSRRTASSVSARRAQATMRVCGLSRRSTRASDEPISPMPISATRSNSGSLISGP